MSDIAIRVEKIGKLYHIGERENYKTLRDIITNTIYAPFRWFNNNSPSKSRNSQSEDLIWALKDVSFEVKHGEVIGIIGRNGAGKSTLLKILSRITEPTEGYIEIHGRVGSLLEVGTGFHPELTGRENLYLNGAILGMKRSEIAKNFDEIVAFAEVEKFIDTPVKHYSSGMYMRLAFAVAAHMDTEILVIDEVLAVGDVAFQKKCLGKMEDVAKKGRTVLFVSHNMTAIKALCNKCVLLDKGQVHFLGDVHQCISHYVVNAPKVLRKTPVSQRKRDGKFSLRAKIVDVSIFTDEAGHDEYIDSTKPFTIQMKVEAYQENSKASAEFIIADELQNLIFFNSGTLFNKIYFLKKGINTIECKIEPTYLFGGEYRINCALTMPGQEVIDYVADAYFFTIRELDPNKVGFNLQKSYGFGLYYVNHQWSELV